MIQDIHTTTETLMTYLNGCGSAGECYKSASSLVLNRRAGRLQQVVNATDKTGTLRRVSMANLTEGKKKNNKNLDVKSSIVLKGLDMTTTSCDSLCKSAPQ